MDASARVPPARCRLRRIPAVPFWSQKVVAAPLLVCSPSALLGYRLDFHSHCFHAVGTTH
eukprot:30850-Pelagococcus_subviridis.AAC.47